MSAAILHGDCLEVLRALDDCSIDAVVTDPPYGLEFMGKEWDTFGVGKQPQIGQPDGSKFRQNMGTPSFTDAGNPTCRNCGGDKYRNGPRKCMCDSPDFGNQQAESMRGFQRWSQGWAAECLRVLKPGGHMVAFGGTRTYHRLTCAIEDAGFEVRDCLMWLYGSGFPKSLDVSKAIDKAAGAAREVVGPPPYTRGRAGQSYSETRRVSYDYDPQPITAPATDDAARWQGFGTALKPGWEPIILARKPLAGTVAANVLTHGTGALNIDGCRIGFAGAGDEAESKQKNRHADFGSGPRDNAVFGADNRTRADQGNYDPPGRWPANVVLTHSEGCVEVGTRVVKGDSRSGAQARGSRPGGMMDTGADKGDGFPNAAVYGPESVAAYRCQPGCPVAELDAQSGRNGSGSGRAKVSSGRKSGNGSWVQDHGMQKAGAENTGVRDFGDSGGASRFFFVAKAGRGERPTADGVNHPTVKPLALIRWLVRMITPPGGTVLDPFGGSGTTAEAAIMEGFDCIIIEREDTYLPLIEQRVQRARPPDPVLL